jgi:hypothetical protein
LQSGRSLKHVAALVGNDHLDRRHPPPCEGCGEVVDGRGTVERQRPELRGGTGRRPAPSQRVREMALAIDANHDPVARVLLVVLERLGASLHDEAIRNYRHVFPTSAVLHLSRVVRIQPLNVQILSVRRPCARHPPREPVVVADDDTR